MVHKVLSVINPWAGLLCLGQKHFETRSFNTSHRGTLLIHSSGRLKKPESKELLIWLYANMDKFPEFKGKDHLQDICSQTGVIIGSVDIVDTFSTNDAEALKQIDEIELRFGNYERDRWFWKCENPVLFDKPIIAKGNLGFWKFEL